jgi:hypothetical protein
VIVTLNLGCIVVKALAVIAENKPAPLVWFWHLASIRGIAALRLLSERSGH